MRPKTLLATVAVVAAALVIAPAARANWMTTNGKPPAFGAEVCGANMMFHYATFLTGMELFTIHPHPLYLRNVVVTDWDPKRGVPSPSGPLYQGNLTVPYNPIQIDLTDFSAPPHQWPGGEEGLFTYSADFVLPLARTVDWGQPVWIRWDDPSGQQPSMYFYQLMFCEQPAHIRAFA